MSRGGGGGSAGGLRVLEETGFSRDTWKTGWTLRAGGSLSLIAHGLMIPEITYRPMYLGVSLLHSVRRGRSREESQTPPGSREPECSDDPPAAGSGPPCA